MLSQVIGAGISSVTETIGNLFTADKERLAARNALQALETNLVTEALQYEARLADAQAAVIQAEAKGNSWIQRSWRPITMLVFVTLVAARWMGWTAPGMSEAEYLSVYELIKIGLGGYIVGRSAEKIAPSIMASLAANRPPSGVT